MDLPPLSLCKMLFLVQNVPVVGVHVKGSSPASDTLELHGMALVFL